MHPATARAPFVALLAAAFALVERWPDPLAQAEQIARTADSFAVAEFACGRAPRVAVGHLIAAALAEEEGVATAARSEIERAARAAPWLGEIQHGVADALLVDAVEQHDPARLAAAARAYAVAVATGTLPTSAAFAALAAADASPALFEQVAGNDRARREALLEHYARRLASELALELAATLDRERGGAGAPMAALAHRRLAAAHLEAGDPALAARHFERAAQLAGTPEVLALDRTQAWFAAGNYEAGSAALVVGLAHGQFDAAQGAALLQAAADPVRASDALYDALRAAPDPQLAPRAAPLFAALGQRERQQQLLLFGGAR